MLFGKYQYSTNIRKRGYSQTCVVQDENGKIFWAKWILGIEGSSTKAKILADKLRHLQKARHSTLPEIIEYGYDDEQQTFAIVFYYLPDVTTLEDSYRNLKIQNFIGGLIELADCLNDLHQKFKINHGDVHPANILVDKNGSFYLVDFGMSDITKTLSQGKDLEIFARNFAAPEKLDKFSSGFPFQSDIYSFGKVVDWFFRERQETLLEEQSKNLQRLLAENPAERPNWLQVIDCLKNFAVLSDKEAVQVAFRQTVTNDFLQTLNNSIPIFDISPKRGENYLMNIIVGNYFCEGVIWVKSENKLLLNEIKPLVSLDEKVIEAKKRNSKRLPYKYSFSYDFPSNKANLTPVFQKWFNQKQVQHSLRENRKAVKDELGFYRELLEKEKEIIKKYSLQLQYYGYQINGDEITFNIKPNDKYSSTGVILKHIEDGNDVNSEGFEYVLSANADRKQNKEVVEFIGKPYDWVQLNDDEQEDKKYALKIKDCEHLRRNNIPQSGYLHENTAIKEEEKNRQLDAIRKVEKNEVQNPDLIYSLFKPDELRARYANYADNLDVRQEDGNGIPFEYSYNQKKAIQNALLRTPLSVIQGPPGTGKTTVITEIVFQILSQKPEAKILITSQTNNAVDQVLENLLKNNISILRLSGITAPKVPSIQEHTMNKKLAGWKKQVRETSEKNFKAKSEQYKQAFGEEFENLTNLHKDWISTLAALDEKSAINQKLIDSIRVIGATCNHIASKKYSRYNFEFDYVIMDESGKATTAEALVPIILGKNLVFVGDHRQLRPMLTSTKEVESWLREKYKKEADGLEDSFEDYFNRPSLFEQVITKIDDDYKAQLDECRRSSKEQVQLTSQCFYEKVNDEPIKPIERAIAKEHNLPLAIDSSIIFVDLGSEDRNGVENKSSYNTKSAECVLEILELLNKYEKVKEYSFGVITGYTAQYRRLRNKIKGKDLRNISHWNKPEDKLSTSVVDRFQGLERDIVIVDLVKSGVGLSLGFLETPNRINVALSRQKRLLIIIGDYTSIVNAKTRSGEKAALQLYLEKIKPEWIVKAEQIKELFSFREKAVIVEKQVTDKIDFEKIKKAATKSWNPEMQKIELTSFLNSMILYIKGFNLKHYGYSTIEKFSEDYGFTVERTDNVGKIYLIPQFDFEKPTEIKKREIKPIPFDEAMSAFHKCKKGNGGLVHTKVYYIQLCKEIRGFKPEDYGGRFNEFYRNMGVFDVVEIAKDNKFLKLKGE